MKKILVNLIIIIIVLGVSIGSTVAYFSDKEVSRDNTFMAGGLDLQVDSTSFYNGKICKDGIWLAKDFKELVCEEQENTFSENKDANQFRCAFKDKCKTFGFDYTIAKWEWNKYQNKYEVEGEANQTNVMGDASLAFWESYYNVDGVIRKAGNKFDLLPGGTNSQVLLRDNKYEISGLYFCAGGSQCGNCILEDGEECDGASSTPSGFLCNSECKLVKKEPCSGTWEAGDLDESIHKFFNFSDLRFGDYGSDTMSLHVYDNDAWGRLVIDDIQNNENTCTDAELLDEEHCKENQDGELLENISFTFWLDMGEVPGFQNTGLAPGDSGFDELEGNNHWDEGEPILFEDYHLDEAGEEIYFKDLLAQVFREHCSARESDGDDANGFCHGIAEDGRLVGDTDYYFGMSWKLPEKFSNEIQSDNLSMDVSLEVEQHRHNAGEFK